MLPHFFWFSLKAFALQLEQLRVPGCMHPALNPQSTASLATRPSVQHPCSCLEVPEAGPCAICCHPGTAMLSPAIQCKSLLQAHCGSCPGQ